MKFEEDDFYFGDYDEQVNEDYDTEASENEWEEDEMIPAFENE